MMGLELRITLHCHEQFTGLLACMNGLPFRSDAHLCSQPKVIYHPSLALWALLVFMILQRPKPERLLGLQMDDQALRHIDFLSRDEPYQKFWRMIYILEHRDFGS